MPNWTDAQLDAIKARRGTVLVSAAAGSGKTAVLVQRVLSLIEEGADVRRMLVVTFTRAAAADMRASLIKALTRASAQDVRFRAQAEAAEYAGISTIHSFCIDVLREYFQRADVDPAFRVADSAEAAILRDRALDAAMNAVYAAENGDLRALAENRTPEQVCQDLAGQGYGALKDAAAEAVIATLAPIQAEHKRIMADKAYIADVLKDGAERASAIAFKTLRKVYKKVGLYQG